MVVKDKGNVVVVCLTTTSVLVVSTIRKQEMDQLHSYEGYKMIHSPTDALASIVRMVVDTGTDASTYPHARIKLARL